jgi:hypothetical protein
MRRFQANPWHAAVAASCEKRSLLRRREFIFEDTYGVIPKLNSAFRLFREPAEGHLDLLGRDVRRIANLSQFAISPSCPSKAARG